MKRKIILTFSILIVSLAFLSQAMAVTYVDDFNRTSGLGANWTADTQYQIVSNTLDNTATTTGWTYLAVYNAVANPTEVSFKWASSSDANGRNSGGIAIYLSSAATNTSGYFIFRRDNSIYLHPIINGDVQRQTIIAETQATRSLPNAGDIIKVIPSTTTSANHFDFYINGSLDARVSDTQKLFGTGSTLYAGLSLYGNSNNNIDDFTVKVPAITVTAPNGGEVWLVNSAHNITWSSSDFSGTVKLEYSTDSGTSWTTILASTANSGTYAWTVPNASSRFCRVRVSDASDSSPSDVSNADFEIAPETEELAMTSPNGGESWVVNSSQTITWYGSSIIPNVRLLYSVDNGTSWTIITSSTPNDGAFSWTVPAQFTTQGRLKIEDALDGLPSDMSNASFSIVAIVSVSVPDASGQPGTAGNLVNVWMNNQTNVRGVIFTLTDSLNYLSATSVVGVGRAVTFTIDDSSDAGNDHVRVVLLSLSGAVIPVGNGPIAQITYSISGGAPYGTTSKMKLSNVMIADANNQLVVPSLTTGNFHYVLSGDVVASGVVDPADLDRAIHLVVHGGTPTAYELLSGDMDHDGDIDLFDTLAIFDRVTFP